jgi:hypothetical protein
VGGADICRPLKISYNIVLEGCTARADICRPPDPLEIFQGYISRGSPKGAFYIGTTE